MKGAPLPSAHIWSSSWAQICFCRYGSPNCPRWEQALLKEHKQQLRDPKWAGKGMELQKYLLEKGVVMCMSTLYK